MGEIMDALRKEIEGKEPNRRVFLNILRIRGIPEAWGQKKKSLN
jgi:hypothetical protein